MTQATDLKVNIPLEEHLAYDAIVSGAGISGLYQLF